MISIKSRSDQTSLLEVLLQTSPTIRALLLCISLRIIIILRNIYLQIMGVILVKSNLLCIYMHDVYSVDLSSINYGFMYKLDIIQIE